MDNEYYFDQRIAQTYDTHADLGSDRSIVEDDVAFYVDLAREAAATGKPVLELGCGTGRVTIPIARAGVDVVGLDNSSPMLEMARRKAGCATNLRWLQADMRDFRLKQRFGLVIIPFRSFLLLPSVKDEKACLTRVHEHLAEDGRLALNFFNPDILQIANWLGEGQSRWLRSRPERHKEVWVRRQYHTAAQEMTETRSEIQVNDDRAIVARVERNLRLRWVYRYEMEHLLALSGFEVEALYGWFDRRPFSDDSDEMVWLARKV